MMPTVAFQVSCAGSLLSEDYADYCVVFGVGLVAVGSMIFSRSPASQIGNKKSFTC